MLKIRHKSQGTENHNICVEGNVRETLHSLKNPILFKELDRCEDIPQLKIPTKTQYAPFQDTTVC